MACFVVAKVGKWPAIARGVTCRLVSIAEPDYTPRECVGLAGTLSVAISTIVTPWSQPMYVTRKYLAMIQWVCLWTEEHLFVLYCTHHCLEFQLKEECDNNWDREKPHDFNHLTDVSQMKGDQWKTSNYTAQAAKQSWRQSESLALQVAKPSIYHVVVRQRCKSSPGIKGIWKRRTYMIMVLNPEVLTTRLFVGGTSGWIM